MRRPSLISQAEHSRRGLVLIIVLIVVTMVALIGFGFVTAMLTENKAVRVRGHHLQVVQAILSGEEAIKSALKQRHQAAPGPESMLTGLTAPASPFTGSAVSSNFAASSNLFDAPDLFRGKPLWTDEENSPIGFSVISPRPSNSASEIPGEKTGYRYGLEDESSRLNLATLRQWEQSFPGAGREALLKLPEMTETIADAILDWLDADHVPREQGAEEDYYSGLNPPISARNGMPQSMEELLLVKGVTRELLFGKDRNQNYQIEEMERQENAAAIPNPSSQENPGWHRFLTLYSRESNRRSNGTPRIFLNDPDLKRLYEGLAAVNAEWAKFVILYRQNGPSVGLPQGAEARGIVLDFAVPGKFPIRTVFDLVDAKVQIPAKGLEPATILNSPFPADKEQLKQILPQLEEVVSERGGSTIAGRINIMTASRTVLAMVPGITSEQVDQIVNGRGTMEGSAPGGSTPGDRRSIGWLYWQGSFDLAAVRRLGPYLTCSGDAYRAQIAGYSMEIKQVQRAEVIIDASGASPRRLYWKDLQLLGPGYPLSMVVSDAAMLQNGSQAASSMNPTSRAE